MDFSKEQKAVLKILLDKYEDSATFLQKNKVRQTFRIRPEEVFPRYSDDAEYDYYVYFNEEMQKLQEAGFVDLEQRSGRIQKVLLRPESLDLIYRAIGRKSKNELMQELKEYLQKKETELQQCRKRDSEHSEVTEALLRYIHNQEKRFSNGKYPEYYDGDSKGYKDIWKCLMYLTELEEDIYMRDLSVLLFQDSKRLETIRAKIESLLHKYGEFAERESILAECSVIQNPNYVQIKGPVRIELGKQSLDVGMLSGEIGLSTKTLADVSGICVYGDRLITIENLTTFHRFPLQKKAAVLYLGGYHNRTKRAFLKKIYEQNPDILYFHFGDIDAGGFYIYEHLKKKTSIPFRTWKMDPETITENIAYAKPLTANDRKRLEMLKEKYQKQDGPRSSEKKNLDTINTMLERNLKLEQEAIRDLSL